MSLDIRFKLVLTLSNFVSPVSTKYNNFCDGSSLGEYFSVINFPISWAESARLSATVLIFFTKFLSCMEGLLFNNWLPSS